uniref:Isocitrate dehydrogenase [NADP] n=1 Tax=Heterorhabditis bacteriophora TaxID=37862 RepID=A0A1I7WQ16_HETBA
MQRALRLTGVTRNACHAQLLVTRGVTTAAPTKKNKIKVKNPVVDLDGDEMTRIIWHEIKNKLIYPYLDLDIKYFDLGLPFRDETDDMVGILFIHMAIRCFQLIFFNRRTVFREPILCKNIPRLVPGWTKPIVIGRHAFGDQATDLVIPQGSILQLVVFMERVVFMKYSLLRIVRVSEWQCIIRKSIMMDDSRTYSKRYMRSLTYETDFKRIGTWYEHRLIDDQVSFFISVQLKEFLEVGIHIRWSMFKVGVIYLIEKLGNPSYLFDLIGYGSLGLMTSVLMCPDGTTIEAEAAHGTVTRHYREYQKGKSTSTNPVASIFAWSRGLHHRGVLDGNEDLKRFALTLEKACIDTIEEGKMTKDLSICVHGSKKGSENGMYLITEDFLSCIDSKLAELMA